MPGFIDLQVNGYAGIDFTAPDLTVDQVRSVADLLVEKGTAGFLATVITAPTEVIERNVATITKAIGQQGARGPILGIHLEGPFLSPVYGYRGAHPEDPIRPPDLAWFQHLRTITEGQLRLVTLALEYEGVREFISAIADEIIVSVGHSNCSFDDVRQAASAGLSMATHVGNGCAQMIDRHDNPIINILGCTDLTLSFIADGFHLPEAFIRLLVAIRPVDQLIVVSDSARWAGMPPGLYSSEGVGYFLREDGRLCLASDHDVMAGSSANMLQCMNHLASLDLLTEDDLWRVGYENPLRVLQMDSSELPRSVDSVRYDPESNRFVLHE